MGRSAFLSAAKDSRLLRLPMKMARFWYYLVTHRKLLLRCLTSAQRKRLSRIAREVLASWRYWRMFPFHYFRYKLYDAGRRSSGRCCVAG